MLKIIEGFKAANHVPRNKGKYYWKRNNRKSQERNRSYKKEPNGNFQTEKYDHQIKENLLDELNSRMKTREGVNELGCR